MCVINRTAFQDIKYDTSVTQVTSSKTRYFFNCQRFFSVEIVP